MGFPHLTIDVPGQWPAIASEVASIRLPDELSLALMALLQSTGPGHRSAHVCATAWVFTPDAEHTMLVRHRRLGWSTPGGHVELHENTREAALRELREETGLSDQHVRLVGPGPAVVHRTDTVVENAEHTHWNVGWLCTAEHSSPINDVEGAQWHRTDDVVNGSVVGAPDLGSVTARLRNLLTN